MQYRTWQDWRPISQQGQLSGFGKLTYQVSPKLTVGAEYSLLRNKIKMPGGLTDEQFEDDSRASVRGRNHLKSPWNILTASLTWTPSACTSLNLKTTYLAGERSLVWFDKKPNELDLPDAQGVFSQRDIELLMDEPCSALDPISTGKVEELMRELKKKYTLIVVTHNMAQAQRVADLTTMMYDGHIIETAPTKLLFQHLQEEVTKNYVQGHFG